MFFFPENRQCIPSVLKPLQCVQEAIKAFCVEEKLDGTDAWRCPRPMDRNPEITGGVSDQQVEIEVF